MICDRVLKRALKNENAMRVTDIYTEIKPVDV
jgi:hypothetical protein